MSLEMMGLGGVLSFDVGTALGNMGSAAAAFGNLGSHANSLSAQMTGVSHAAAGISAALLPLEAMFGLSVKVSGDFEQALQNAVAVSPSTKAAIGEVEQKLLDMGRAGKFSAVETANAYADMAHVIPNASDALTSLVAVTNLATATGDSLHDSQHAVVSAMEQYSLGADQAAHITDVFATATGRSQEKLNDLAEGFKVAAPAARLSGVSFEDTAAQLITLADAGIKGQEGGTALANMFRTLEKPSKDSIAIMQALGITVKDKVTGNFRAAKELVPELMEGLKRFHGTADQARAALEVFGMRGVRAAEALAMVSKLQKGYEANAEALEHAAGAAKKIGDTKMDTFEGSLTKLKNSATEFAVELGKPLLEPLRDTFKVVGNFIDDLRARWRALSPETKEAIGRIVVFAGIVGGVLATATGAFAGIIAVAAPLVSVLGFATANAVGLQFALIAALSPFAEFLPVVGAIAAVVGVAALAWHFFSDEIEAFWDGFSEAVGPSLKTFGDLWDQIVVTARAVWMDFADAFESDGSDFTVLFSKIGKVSGIVVGAMIEGFTTLVSWLVTAVGWVANLAATFLGPAWKAVANTVSQVSLAIRELFAGDIIRGLARLGTAFVDSILIPLRTVVGEMLKLAEPLHFNGPLIDSLKQFANQGLASFMPTNLRESETIEVAPQKYKIENVIHNHVTVDGKEVALAAGRHEAEIDERGGFKATPYQRRLAVIRGATPIVQPAR